MMDNYNVIHQKRDTVFHHQTPRRELEEKERIENMTRGGVCLTNFEVFENVIKHCVSLRYLRLPNHRHGYVSIVHVLALH